MFTLFIGTLLVIAFGAVAVQIFLKIRSLRAVERGSASLLEVDRYRPMLRLLSDEDLAFVSSDSKLQRMLRTRRRELFRGYLRCLTKDYAHLLAGVREVMVRSGHDRPDLVQALAKNRMLFAIAVCKVEFRLALHATGAGSVDVSGLVEALEALRGQVSVLSAAPMTA